MFNLTGVTIATCVERLKAGYRKTYGYYKADYADVIGWVANLALSNIAKGDAAYHNVEHTILVALAGQEILRGKQIHEGSVSCEDWLHSMISLLCHDIGYIRGICHLDRASKGLFATGVDQETISLPPNATDASLTPYHVDRGKQFVEEQLAWIASIDIEVIQRNIELTRFPVPADPQHQDTLNYPGLTRAADLIGQLSDPYYLQKMAALFREFEEVGVTQNLGYRHPRDLRANYPNFFWNVAYRYMQDGLHYLEATTMGQQIIASLFENVRIVEAELLSSVPQTA
ncbi:MAG TPA: Npun_R2479 family HD domain-containing metalloprotein [Coleofasciculaceae cyanobacterium]